MLKDTSLISQFICYVQMRSTRYLTAPWRCFFVYNFCNLCFMFVFLNYAVLSVPCNLVVACWERADLLALLCVMFSCVVVTFPYDFPVRCDT